jgi:NosR/NirI family transcriptional regulator, nitrous oxide reductase regulator
MRLAIVMGSILLGGAVVAGMQAPADAKMLADLKKLFPAATTFSAKESPPPHYKAYVNDPKSGAKTLVGVAFLTTELEPLERGYDGPIKILVGMNLNGVLSGIVVVAHREPYGYFSVESPKFQAQFVGKNINDPFRVGADIDAVSRASISIASATRAVRNSSRRVARQLLTPPSETPR